MADKRQQILDAIVTRMGLILTASGYRTNAGQNVWLERATLVTESETPAILISDEGSPPDVEGMGGNTSRWYYQLQVKFDIKATGATAGTIARKVKEDIKQAIGTDVQWGGLANWTMIADDDQSYDHKELKVMEASLVFNIRYFTNQWASE